MKKLVLLFAALLLAGCGEKSSSEGSESASEKPTASNDSAEASADTAKPPPAETPVAESPSEEPSSDTPKSLSDADVGRLVKEAVDFESFEEREGLFYHANESEPFSGWAKEMAGSGQVSRLGRFKDGKQGGFTTVWYGNGQKKAEATYKDGKVDGLRTSWHENGQKWEEETYKDGEVVSVKYWNSKGEEVETSFDSLE